MEFYKKNPVISGVIWVQGKRIDDDTVVAGDEFKPFSDPGTFPGVPPKLVKVEGEVLDAQQRSDVDNLVREQASRPPRHLGVIKSSQFAVTNDGNIRVYKDAVRKDGDGVDLVGVKKQGKSVSKLSDKASIDGDGLEDGVFVFDREKRINQSLSVLYTEGEMVDKFPGVTSKNVAGVLKIFDTLESLASASNMDLKLAGVQPSFYRRVRGAAKDELEGLK